MTVRNYVRHLSGSGTVVCGSRGLPTNFAQCLGIGGGFALHEALWLGVVGVSDPHVVQFPPIAGAVAASALMLCPNCRPPRRITAKTGSCGRGGLRFGQNGVSHGARRRADAPAGERAHERGHVRSAGHVCGAAEWAFAKADSLRAKQKPRSLRFGGLLVAPTGVDPVTFRFSVERSTN